MGKATFDIQSAGSSATNLFPEIRKPSKVRAVLIVLVILLLVLSIVFIGLYVKEKDGDSDRSFAGSVGEQDNGTKTTRTPTTNQPCSTPACVVSAAGKF